MTATARRLVFAALLVPAALISDRQILNAQGTVDRTERLILRTWPSPADAKAFPERQSEEFAHLWQRKFSIAFSGGGTRAASASWGQLRGLHHLGWLDQVRYVAAVSGGAWTAVPFTFLDPLTCDPATFGDCPEDDPSEVEKRKELQRERRQQKKAACSDDWPDAYQGKTHDDILLQAYRPPAEITDCDLGRRYVPRRSLASDLSSARLFKNYISRLPFRGDETYGRSIGKRFLDTARLYDDPGAKPQPKHRYFLHSEAQRDELFDRSKTLQTNLTAADFGTVKVTGRPFLVVGATQLDAKRFVNAHWRLFPVELTSMYVGTSQRLLSARRDRATGSGRKEIGGGFLEAPGLDAKLYDFRPCPGSTGESCALVERRQVMGLLQNHKFRFILSDVMGSSGAAPVKALRRFGLNLFGFPEFRNTSLGNSTKRATEHAFGDGGHIDNLGLTSLLAREEKQIVVFVNSKMKWATASSRENCRKPDQLQKVFCKEWIHHRDALDAKAAKKTGDHRERLLAPEGWKQVKEAFDKLAALGTNNGKVKAPLVHCGIFKTVPNDRFGIPAYDPKICWVYLERSTMWTDELRDSDGNERVRKLKNLEGYGRWSELGTFPHYPTLFPRWLRLIDLSMFQVQALGHLTSWVVVASAPAVAECFGLPSLPQTAVSQAIQAHNACTP